MLVTLLAFALQAAAPAAAPPSPEAVALGRRLAATGGLATMAPMLIEKDIADLSQDAGDLTADERAKLVALGRSLGKQGVERLVHALGESYARELSLADLKVLVAQAEHPAAARRRAIEPKAVMGAMTSLGDLDFKKELAEAFCKQSGKLCGWH